MSQQIFGINNFLTDDTRNGLQDLNVFLKALYWNYGAGEFSNFERNYEGIFTGLRCTAKGSPTDTVEISNGIAIIDCGGTMMIFQLDEGAGYLDVQIPNLGTATKRYLIALKVDLTNYTAEIDVFEGAVATDPTLTEGGDPEVYYLPIARITDDGDSVVGDSEIAQLVLEDNVTTFASGTTEYVGSYVGINSNRYRVNSKARLSMTSDWSYGVSSNVESEISFNTEEGILGSDTYEYVTVGGKKRIKVLKSDDYLVNVRCRLKNTSGNQTNAYIYIYVNDVLQGQFLRYGMNGATSFNNGLNWARKLYLPKDSVVHVTLVVSYTNGAISIGGSDDGESFISIGKFF